MSAENVTQLNYRSNLVLIFHITAVNLDGFDEYLYALRSAVACSPDLALPFLPKAF